jgi:pre-mRNA-splicing factor SYF1
MISKLMDVPPPADELSPDAPDVDLRMARLEYLLDRRPLLLSSVLLRQNPHNVHEWHKRVRLLDGDPDAIVKTYSDAVKTVKPELAVWVEGGSCLFEGVCVWGGLGGVGVLGSLFPTPPLR